MAQQLTDNLFFRGGYVDEVMSVDTFSDLSSLSAAKKFVGLTVTVKNALTSDAGKSVPVNVWLSEGRGNTNWIIKDIPPIDNLSQLNVIPEGFLPNGFRVSIKNGESFIYKGVDDESQKQWEAEIRQEEFDKTVADAVELAIDNITSGASEAFDTLKEVEDWINNHKGDGPVDVEVIKDVENLKLSAHTHDNKEIIDAITTEKINTWDNSSKAGGTVLDESITVTRDAGNYKNGMTIEEGTTVLEVLKNFLRTTYYPSIATKPTADIIINGEVLESYEVGSTIEIPEVSINTINGKFNYNNYNGVEVNGGDFYEVKIKSELIDGFENYISSNEYVGNKIDSQSNIVVSEGVNEIVFNGYTKYNAPNNMPTTSEGVSTTQTGSTGSDNSATWENGEIILNKTIKVFGYRNIYFGTTDSKEEISNDLIKSLNITNKVVTNDTVLETVTDDINNHNRMIIAVPENKTLKLVEDSTSTQDITKLLLLTEKKLEICNENSQETSIYNVYDKSWAGSFGNETWFIKIKNK